ncbi:hypothetical protein NDU88_009912 [Pleurodeles waltl]|uniref:Secreted protein n=1 Tax=Pleurodeles waltl TaxID=8319 RepID=A0AAV7PTF1_PLEWA|nr:hypothetical protein NDU88_009912 [Pleurodeles waltl]
MRKTELLLTRPSLDIFAVVLCKLCRSAMVRRCPDMRVTPAVQVHDVSEVTLGSRWSRADLQLTPGLGVYRRRKPSWTIWDLAALKAYSGRC